MCRPYRRRHGYELVCCALTWKLWEIFRGPLVCVNFVLGALYFVLCSQLYRRLSSEPRNAKHQVQSSKYKDVQLYYGLPTTNYECTLAQQPL